MALSKNCTTEEVRAAVGKFFTVGMEIELPEMKGVVVDFYPTGREHTETQAACKIEWTTNQRFKFVTVELLEDIDQRIERPSHFNLLQAAAKIGGDHALLRKRLKEAESCFYPDWKKVFKGAKFEFEQQRLMSKPTTFSGGDPGDPDDYIFMGSTYVLEWQVRSIPLSPPSYENQQTSVGRVWVRAFG